jgi:hypothetical protein
MHTNMEAGHFGGHRRFFVPVLCGPTQMPLFNEKSGILATFVCLPISQPSVSTVGARKQDGFLDDHIPSLERYPLRVRYSSNPRSFATWPIALSDRAICCTSLAHYV